MDAFGRQQRWKPALDSAKSTATLKDRDMKSTSSVGAKSAETVRNRDIKPTSPIAVKSTEAVKNRDINPTSPTDAKSMEVVKNRNIKPTSPIDPYKCGGCAQLYNDSDRLPMVLSCGHRNCRKCMYDGRMPRRSMYATCAVCQQRSDVMIHLVPIDTPRLQKITTRRLLLEDLLQELGKVEETGESPTVEGIDRLMHRVTSAIAKGMEQLSRETFDKATSTEVTEYCGSNRRAYDDLRSRRNAQDGTGDYSEDLHLVMQESGIRHISKFCVGGGTYSYCHLCKRPIPSDSKSYEIHLQGRGHACAREQYEKKMSTIRDDVNPSSSSDRPGYYRDVIGGLWIKKWC